jgi:hypothetical protein
MRLSSLLIALLIAAVPGLASAAEVDSTKRIDERQDRQDQRIEKGAKSGDLTKKEAKRLEKGQARIDAAEKKAAADGKITKEERARIEKMQDQQAREIRKQSTDKQERGAAAGKAPASAGSSGAHASGAANLGQLEVLIGQEERKAMADGRISAQERARLDALYTERDARQKNRD